MQTGQAASRALDNGRALETMPANLCRLSAAVLARGYARGDFSPVDVIESLLARIDEVNGALNAIVTLDAAGARAAARASEIRWRARTARGSLDGVPLTVKDNINVCGLRTTWGSRLYADFIPTVDELPVARAREAGMVIVGKTNVPEFTLSGYTDNVLFGPTRNPWDLRLTPGGSSGGAVTAVAAGMGPITLGTDGGGSIRRPASHTGVVGFKPSRGRVARSNGLPQILLDFEVVGAMARTTDDVVQIMAVIGASDPRDPASVEFADRPWSLPAPKRCRVLYVPKFDNNPVDDEIATSVERAAQTLAGLGHAVTESAAPFAVDAFNAVWPVISQTGLAVLLNSVPRWREQISTPFVEMAEAGARLRATELFDALEEIGRMRARLSATFAQYDVVLTPTAAALPWPAQDAFPTHIAGREVGPRGHAVFTAFANASGCPAISLPCTPSRAGLPIGFQLIAAPGHDERLCVLAHEYELVAPWADRWPPL